MDAKKKILVTGVAGFIGSHLADRLLKEGYEVVGIDNLAYGRMEQVPQGVDFRNIDVRSKDIYAALKDVRAVFHLAAKNDLFACQEDPVGTMDINVHGTANVLEAARRAGVAKVVLSSSSALEEGEARLKGFYAISKATCEKIVEGYRAAFGLEYVILRYFNVFGPRQDYRRSHPPVVSSFLLRVLRHEAPVLYEGDEENRRDFIYVDDINDFHLACLGGNAMNGRTIRLGSGVSTSVQDLWDAVKDATGTDLQPTMRPRQPGDIVVTPKADLSEAAALGWKPKTSLADGLRTQFEYLKAEFAKEGTM